MKIFSLFSVVRGYNIPIIFIAQYLSAIYILSPENSALRTILDFKLLLFALASSISIASGYIINNFYDSQKDLINKPNKSVLDRLVSQSTKLKVYFALNAIAAILAFFVSFYVFIYFSAYIFAIWFYSHKLKKILIIGNISAALLAMAPFFALLLHYYSNLPFDEIENYKHKLLLIFLHAGFLFLLLFSKEIIKDLVNIKGDLANNYPTIPVVFDEKTSKISIYTLLSTSIIPVYFLIQNYDVGYMDSYFYICFLSFVYLFVLLEKANSKETYQKTLNIIKILIVLGVFSILLIEPSVLVNGKRLLFSN